MANFKIDNKTSEKKLLPVKKIVGITMAALSSVAFLGLFTNLIGFLKMFLLGMFGLFAYPLFLVLFVVGIALINNKKYMLSKRYIVFLTLAIFSLIAIIHLATTHSFSGSFGEYLAYSYSNKLTAGGFVCGILVAPFRFLFFSSGSYVIFSILLIVSVALIVDYFYYAKNVSDFKKPLKIIKPLATVDNGTSLQPLKPQAKVREFVPLTLNAQIQESQKEVSAKEKLGLLKTNIIDKSPNISDEMPPIVNRINEKPKDNLSIKEYLLSKPDEVDLSNYRKTIFSNQTDINKNIAEIKKENNLINPEKIVHDEFVNFKNNFIEPKENLNKPANYVIDNNITDNFNKEQEEIIDPISNIENEVLKNLNNATPEINLESNNVNLNSGRRRGGFSQLSVEDQNSLPKVKALCCDNTKTAYNKPPIELFTTMSENPDDLNEDIVSKRIQLEYALETFNVPAKVIAVVVGPAVTRYELEMPAGISVRKIQSHADDIALTLASNGDIRIEAPIPGRSAVGIEVPNDKIAKVGLREVLCSKEFNLSNSPLTLALGKDISGSIKICDLVKMPHLLVAGATNSGKSVCLNAIILSLISKCSPQEVKLILIDPKMVEFSMYNGLPHLILPNVITDTTKAVNALGWAVEEMERRFVFLNQNKVRNIQEYNILEEVVNGTTPKMPYIVIIVDELADLMTVAKKEIEDKILRLAQKARAAGIHMILATQRPSVDVITGLIKANFPSRITFALTSFADSKTILDQGGADKLLGKGDMLYLPSDASAPKRIQGCFMTGKEVEAAVNFVKENNNYEFDKETELSIISPKQQSNACDLVDGTCGNSFDEFMEQALKLVIENGQASITILQRKLLIGYPRAARIIDQMETAGFISPSDGSKPRSVYMTMEEWEKLFNKE